MILIGEYIPENFLLRRRDGKWQLAGLIDFGDALTGFAEYDLSGLAIRKMACAQETGARWFCTSDRQRCLFVCNAIDPEIVVSPIFTRLIIGLSDPYGLVKVWHEPCEVSSKSPPSGCVGAHR